MPSRGLLRDCTTSPINRLQLYPRRWNLLFCVWLMVLVWWGGSGDSIVAVARASCHINTRHTCLTCHVSRSGTRQPRTTDILTHSLIRGDCFDMWYSCEDGRATGEENIQLPSTIKLSSTQFKLINWNKLQIDRCTAEIYVMSAENVWLIDNNGL